MATSNLISRRPLALLALLLLLLAAALSVAPVSPAQAASCSDTFEVPIEEDTGEDMQAGPDDQVIEIQLGARTLDRVTTYAGCGSSKPKSNPNPGFGVVPGRGTTPRRIFDERRGQAGRDAEQLAASRKKRAKSRR